MSSLVMPAEVAEQGLCQQVDPELFFPEDGGSTREPKRVCAACPVWRECRAWALENGVRHGVWGGLSDRERKRVRRRARTA